MPPIHFKLTRPDGQTRRITFDNLPAWHELAARLQALYDIPLASVGVSYIDNDNDEITASSNEELQDYYQTSLKQGQAIKFKVLDLSLASSGHTPFAAATPPINPNRNTFGPGIDDLDLSDWQRLGRFDLPGFVEPFSNGPHAFIETVTTNASGVERDTGDNTETESEGDKSTVLPPCVEKGKHKATSSLGAASTTSVIGEEVEQKYPVHVLNHAQPSEPITLISRDEGPVQSSPKPPSVSVETPINENTPMDEDPPLPSLDDLPSNASANLTHDIATLLGTLTSIISSHPELSEGIRNIVRNATNGAYWETHRSNLSQAANEFRQATNGFEQEAAQRISDALGNFFRSFNHGSEEDGVNRPPQSTAPPFPWYQPPPGGRHPWGRRSMAAFGPQPPWGQFWNNHTPWAPPPPPPPPSGPSQQGPPPPPPPPPPVPPPLGRPFAYVPFPPPPPPPPPPPHFHMFPNRIPPPPGPRPAHDESGSEPTPDVTSLKHPPPPPPDVQGIDNSSSLGDPHPPQHGLHYSNAFNSGTSLRETEHTGSKLTEQQLRTRVEEAKRLYKAEKAAYRHGREERKNEKSGRDTHDTSAARTGDFSPQAETSQGNIVSRAWGSYPQLELYNAANRAPRRYNTHLGHGHRDELNDRAQSRIAKRLADMGFAESSHPELPRKIKTQLAKDKVVTKEQEDDIVTNLLEALLAQGPRSPIASGSNMKKQGVSETWGEL